jgi:outer membrane lipoprotein-sorting protein
MNSIKTFTLSLAAVLLLFMSAYAQHSSTESLPAVDQIIDQYIDAVGGREAFEPLNTRVCKVKAIRDLSWTDPQRQEIAIDAYAKFPGKWLVIDHKPAGDRYEAFDGNTSWVQKPDSAAREDSSKNVKFAFLYDPRNALRLTEYFPDLSVKGTKDLNGRAVYTVESSQLDPLHYTLYFDVETGLLNGIGSYWELQDYREVDGVLLPHRISCSRKGGSSTYIFEDIKHNAPVDDAMFSMPDVGEQ